MSSKSNTRHGQSNSTPSSLQLGAAYCWGMVAGLCLMMGVIVASLAMLKSQIESADFQRTAQQTVTPFQSESVSENSKAVPRDTTDFEE